MIIIQIGIQIDEVTSMKSKYVTVVTMVILSGLFLLSASSQNRTHVGLNEKIDEYMKRVTSQGFSGALLVAKDGKVVLSKGYGMANRERGIPNTDETVFTIGSITKQFTGAAILKLQMMGKLSVTDPITKYFDNVPADKSAITLHHLLTHTAGFPGAIGDDFDPIPKDEFVRLAMNTELRRRPGELYEYSNVGYSLLGAIVELVSGKSYESFLHEHLFKPAGMNKTGYLLPQWKKEDLAHGYRGDKDWGTLRDRPWAEDGPGWHLRANGGILSTVGDMYKWHLALEGNRILSEEAKIAYYKPHVPEGEDASSYYGYGWAIFTTPRNTKLIAHNGGNTIFAADFLRYIDEDVVVIALSNTAGKPAWKVSRVIARIAFGEDYELPPEKIVTLSESELQKSPMGKHALALCDVYRGGDENAIRRFIEAHIEPEVVERNTMEKIVRMIKKDQEEIGDLKLGYAVQTGDYSLELTMMSKPTGQWWLITLRFTQESPNLIKEIGIVDTIPPTESAGEADDDITSKWGLPDSNTGRRGTAILEAIDRQDNDYSRQFITENYSPEFLNNVTSEEQLDRFKKWHEEIGRIELLGAMKTGPYSARLKIQSQETGKQFYIIYECESSPPYRIESLTIEAVE